MMVLSAVHSIVSDPGTFHVQLSIAPLLIAAIASGVGNLIGGISAKKKANAQQDLEKKQYDEQVRAYMEEFAKEEDKRQERVRLVDAFAKANNINGITPEMISALMTRRTPTAPPAYIKAGTPGWGLDMLGIGANAAGSIWGAANATKLAGKTMPKLNPSLLLPKNVPASLGSGFGSTVRFGSPATWGLGG